MIMPLLARDRRRHVRVACERPVRVRCGWAGRCLSGQTLDVSDGGCLMRLDRGDQVEPGDPVRVGIAHRPGQALIFADNMVSGTVVRRLGHDETQHVAVRFEHVTTIAAAG
ncbi:MAG: PilZ domain-containing protein [Planctomycetota bacterium]